MMGTLRTTALMAFLIVLFALVGGAIGGSGGMTIALVIALGLNFFSYWFSDSIVLKMHGAQEIQRADAPELYDMVDRLRKRADLPMPRVCIIPQDQPNAFATGRNPQNGVVAVTQGIMRTLSRDELEGVIAHELAHIKNRDILISSVAATMAAAITLLARFGFFFGGRDQNFVSMLLMMILAPLAAVLIQMAISRSREYVADRDGADIAGNPRGLANALQRLERAAQQRPMRGGSEATSHLFIVNPFSGGMSGLRTLFSTHPSTEERISRLQQMARSGT
ncbi:MAG: zinc metalloprotease HtpX [Longimonas sp.]